MDKISQHVAMSWKKLKKLSQKVLKKKGLQKNYENKPL